MNHDQSHIANDVHIYFIITRATRLHSKANASARVNEEFQQSKLEFIPYAHYMFTQFRVFEQHRVEMIYIYVR